MKRYESLKRFKISNTLHFAITGDLNLYSILSNLNNKYWKVKFTKNINRKAKSFCSTHWNFLANFRYAILPVWRWFHANYIRARRKSDGDWLKAIGLLFHPTRNSTRKNASVLNLTWFEKKAECLLKAVNFHLYLRAMQLNCTNWFVLLCKKKKINLEIKKNIYYY